MTWRIYVACNKENWKCYVGLTSGTLNKRKNAHAAISRGLPAGKKRFHKAITHHGIESFEWCIIEDELQTLDEANNAEQRWIEHFRSFEFGYNLTKGGDGTFGHSFKHTDEAKKKISSALSGIAKKEFSLVHRQKISEAGTKRKHSEEVRLNMGDAVRKRYAIKRAKHNCEGFADIEEPMVDCVDEHE